MFLDLNYNKKLKNSQIVAYLLYILLNTWKYTYCIVNVELKEMKKNKYVGFILSY